MLPSFYSTGKWYTSLEQPHDEMHLAIGGQDHRPTKMATPKLYDKNNENIEPDTIAPVGGGFGLLWFVTPRVWQTSTSSGSFDVSRCALPLSCYVYTICINPCMKVCEDGSSAGRYRAHVDSRNVRSSSRSAASEMTLALSLESEHSVALLRNPDDTKGRSIRLSCMQVHPRRRHAILLFRCCRNYR